MRETYAIRGRKISLQSVKDLISTKLPQNEPANSPSGRSVHKSGIIYQALAILFCVLFGLAMIVNTQLGGESEWFWYARLFHSGAKLYADLHLPLQPLYVLETNAWIQLFGIKCLVTEIPSLFHVLAFCLGILLILRESDWPDWQKAIVLVSAFFICINCTAYRFDDYHITTDIFIFYSLVLLLALAKTQGGRPLWLAAGLGILAGLAITSRLNDGTALLVATGVCLLFLTRTRKLLVASLFVVAAVLTVIFVVKLTGDSLSAYASNSIVKAAGAKGGTQSIVTAPFRLFPNALQMFRGRRWILVWVIVIIAAGAFVKRNWKDGSRYIYAVQFGIAGAAFAVSPHYRQDQLLLGGFVEALSVFLIVVNYLLLPFVAARFLMSRIGDGMRHWDAREILILLPLAELASASASTGAATLNGFLFSQIAMLLLLIPVIQPFRRQASWANASLLTIMALMGLSVMTVKIHNPYSWILFRSSPMFVNRQWYQHPVYGPMYIDRDLLHFVQPVCLDIGNGTPKPELLSMPFSYANYFCDTPPWHGYVQTFFDTSTRSTIAHLMSELDTAPPTWIVYQRQMKVVTEHEGSLHQGQPLAHRDLDNMIMQKISTGQWQVVRRSNYLFVDTNDYQEGDGWWIIRTRP
jgi:hypothetical protein